MHIAVAHSLIIPPGIPPSLFLLPPDTYKLLEEDDSGHVRFLVPFHYESRVQSAASSASHGAARARRLAQEVTTLATSLPLSPSSSVFVRCDEERLDIMKVRR